MQLNDIQDGFKDLMLAHPRALDNPPPGFASMFSDGDDLPARLKIYRNNIVGSLTDVIIATFPVTDKLVGRAFFETMARSFILAHPPPQGCVSLYGGGFDSFIQTYAPAKDLPYLPNVAAFEIAFNGSYYAPDDTALTAQDMGAIAPEALPDFVLNLRPSVRLFRSAYPLTGIRDFCLRGGNEGTLDIGAGGELIVIHRPDIDVIVTLLTEGEMRLLELFQKKTKLGDAVESVFAFDPAFDFQKFLQKFITLKIFSRGETP